MENLTVQELALLLGSQHPLLEEDNLTQSLGHGETVLMKNDVATEKSCQEQGR